MSVRLLVGDARETLATLEPGSVHMCATSPPYYGLRDYGLPPLVWGGDAAHAHEWATVIKPAANGIVASAMQGETLNGTSGTRKPSSSGLCPCGAWLGSLGLEPTPGLYIEHLVDVFRHVRRVLRDDSVCFINLGDSYAGSGKGPSNSLQSQASQLNRGKGQLNGAPQQWLQVPEGAKPKDLLLMPFRVAMALQADGWYLRSVIPWLKRNAMPESVRGSRWSRHQVTMEEYEKLSGLRYTGQRNDDTRTRDVSDLQPSAIPENQATVSAESEGSSHSEGPRTATGRKGKTSSSQPLITGESQQSEVRSNRQGAGNAGESDPEIQAVSSREGKAARARCTTEVSPGLARAEESIGPALADITQGTHGAGGDGTTPAESDQGISDRRCDNGAVAVDPRAASLQMFLLQEEANATDDGSRHSSQPRRGAPERERSASLPVVQFEEEQPADDALVDCPGCDQCRSHDGYILHMSAGRPSTSVEYVFLLAKSRRYFWDADAVRVALSPNATHEHRRAQNGGGSTESLNGHDYSREGFGVMRSNPNGRNRRNADWFFESWQGLLTDEQSGDPLAFVVNPAPFTGAHFATFPPKLVEPMILAGTSEKGCCPECGAPWVRVTEREGSTSRATGKSADKRSQGLATAFSGYEDGSSAPTFITVGWRASCAHAEAAPVPCTVLDPFAGAATTLLVADRLGRNAIGCELNDAYATMATDRVVGDSPLFTEVSA